MEKYTPDEKESIITGLTRNQEAILADIHAKGYTGTDDDMPEAFEAWLESQPVELLKEYLATYA
jgi:hypothetical protein